MKKLIISLLLGAMALTSAAEQRELLTDSTSLHCQIEGQEITFPCHWSELERLGWNFSNPADSAEIVLPVYDLLLLDGRQVSVLSPQKRKATIMFCNVSDKEVTRTQSLVFGISYTSDNDPTTVYDFKLPLGIASGISTQKDVRAAYGGPREIEMHDLDTRWRYAEPFSNSIDVIVANNKTEVASEGTVIGFGITTDAVVKEMIKKAGFALSDELAREIGKKRMYEQDIVSWTKELQLAETDSVKNNPIYISRIKYALSMNHYNLGNFKEAFDWMLQSAEAGDSETQFSLGVMYSDGLGVEQDYKSAVSWYEKAALQGHVAAMNNLGNCYNYGNGVQENLPEAFKWWLKAAQGEYEPCYALVAGIYYEGIYGVKKDYKEAIFWYEKAAKAGDKEAIYNLSCMYYAGQGVKRNYDKSFELLMQSDENQYYTQQALGEHYYYGRGVEKDVPRALTYFNNYLTLIENEDEDTRNAFVKETTLARKIIEKNKKR